MRLDGQFQSTRPCGARRGPPYNRRGRDSFNPRARAGRDGWRNVEGELWREFQSTRPCGARLLGCLSRQSGDHVSIHAPVRGATRSALVWAWPIRVSIHAPVRGATLVLGVELIRAEGFNPRARAGRDIISSPSGMSCDGFQSTRPCGARLRGQILRHPMPPSFNPRARAGRDIWGANFLQPLCCFNPRARAGRDLSTIEMVSLCARFNPRARAGRDQLDAGGGELLVEVSIHAPVRGATGRRQLRRLTISVSIHAPVRGAT